MRIGRLLTRLGSLGLALGLLGALQPHLRADDDQTVPIMLRYDVDSATVTYCSITGQNGVVGGGTIQGPGTVTTSGSSVAVTSVSGFGDLSVGDILVVRRPGATDADVRRVLAKASASALTLDEPANWPTLGWRWWKQSCGTTDSDGWVGVAGRSAKRFEVDFDQGDIDGLEWRIECRGGHPGALAQVVFPGTATACGAGSVASGYCRFAAATAGIAGRYSVLDTVPWDACRIGFKYQSSDASDTGADLVTNGTFTGNANGWTLGLGGGAPDWAYAANAVSHADSGGTAALTPTVAITIVAGHAYTVAFTISAYTAGSLTATVGGTAGTARSSAATFTETLVATTTGNLLLTPTTTFAGTVDNVSVVDLTGANLEKVSAAVTLSDIRR